MWTCPTCQRSFKRRDQRHTCTLISKESLFAKRPPELKKLYEKIVKEVKQFGKYREETVRPDVIFFKTKSTFLGIKVKKMDEAVLYLNCQFYRQIFFSVPGNKPCGYHR